MNQHLECLFPSTTDQSVLDGLGPADLCRFAKTCIFVREKVMSYTRMSFTLRNVLGKYFPAEQIPHFRDLMASTGIFISGSTALQFFERVVYPESDLDLYAEHRRVDVIIRWLLKAGYELIPPAHEDDDPLTDDEDPVDMEPLTVDDDTFSPLKLTEYFGVKKIFSFIHENSGERIQIITSIHCPLQLLLSFHSTCVENLITHEKAYAIYPAATFTEKRTLVLPFFKLPDQTPAIAKYADCGWALTHKLTRREAFDPYSAFAPGQRYLGDSLCWSIELQPQINYESTSCMEAHTWATLYDEHLDFKLDAAVFLSPRLEHGYVVSATAMSRRELTGIFDELKSRNMNKE